MTSILEFIECVEVGGFKVNCIKNDIIITKYLKDKNKLWEEDWLEIYIKESYIKKYKYD
jgi:hypothetical protein